MTSLARSQIILGFYLTRVKNDLGDLRMIFGKQSEMDGVTMWERGGKAHGGPL